MCIIGNVMFDSCEKVVNYFGTKLLLFCLSTYPLYIFNILY